MEICLALTADSDGLEVPADRPSEVTRESYAGSYTARCSQDLITRMSGLDVAASKLCSIRYGNVACEEDHSEEDQVDTSFNLLLAHISCIVIYGRSSREGIPRLSWNSESGPINFISVLVSARLRSGIVSETGSIASAWTPAS